MPKPYRNKQLHILLPWTVADVEERMQKDNVDVTPETVQAAVDAILAGGMAGAEAVYDELRQTIGPFLSELRARNRVG